MTAERWRQVEKLYHSALERQPDQRGVFLTEACQGDEELRREVESLLSQNVSAEGALDRPAWEAAQTLEPGARLGPYQVLDTLGAGGMGQVYRARDSRLNRTVAIKVVHAKMADRADFRQRLQREGRAVSALNHPHIGSLYDIGEQDGVDYLVMEYIEGKTLAERLRKGPLPMDQTMRFGAQLADALAAAHSQGIVHRDLKPGNVMVTKSGVKVLDFGLAKFTRRSAATTDSTATLTANHAIAGTLAYMAPEQIEGKE